jgi:hypothetical protein
MKLALSVSLLLCTATIAALPAEPIRYEIRYGTNPAALSLVAETVEETITLSNLAQGVTYYATVQAISPDGVRSEPSAMIVYQVPQEELIEVVEIQTSLDLKNWTTTAWIPLRKEEVPAKFVRARLHKIKP